MLGFEKRRNYFLIAVFAIAVAFYFCLPDPLFKDSYSTVLNDRNGELLSASIAADGQWRFPESDSISEKFAQALVTFEDKRFWHHPGVDVLSLSRAFRENVKAGKIVSGGSTISMQLIRLSRKEKSRTYLEKIAEIILATRLELAYSKSEILAMYASHAPFGGNVVGLEAACWRYFGRDSRDLSWAEAAMFAVLPNSPSLIHLAKNREALKIKRDKLLDKLALNGKMDSPTCELAKAESVPQSPLDLPRYARHLLVRAMKEGHQQTKVSSTLQLPLQMHVEQIVQMHHQRLKSNQIFNAAAIVLEVAGMISMKLSHGFALAVPSVLLFLFYGASFTCLNFALRTIDVSVAYAIWSAVGLTLVAAIGILLLRESAGALKLASIVLIVAGVVGLYTGAGGHG